LPTNDAPFAENVSRREFGGVPEMDAAGVAARELFRRYGLRGIGVDAIAKVAGTNKMTMYRRFRSKEQLVVACLQQAIGEAEAVWRRFELDYSSDPLSQLRAGFNVARPASAMNGAAMAAFGESPNFSVRCPARGGRRFAKI
jgi:AcrR family transcriptional regulator